MDLNLFNDLYVIAAGVTMAYIYFDRGSAGKKKPFFSFLISIAEDLMKSVADKRKKDIEDEYQIRERFRYLKSRRMLDDDLLTKIDYLESCIDGEIKKISDIQGEACNQIESITKVECLSVISFDCFLYSLLLLYIGVITETTCIDIFPLLDVSSLAILLLSISCELAEWGHLAGCAKKKKHLVVWLVIFLLVLLQCHFNVHFCEYLDTTCFYLSPFLCFSGFLTYMIVTAILSIGNFFIYWNKIRKVDIHKSFYKDAMHDFEQRTQLLDQNLNDEPVDDVVSVQ